ncbi:MAG: hypothetical protein L0G85_00200 [Kocuria sp.]|nr:hypothetical protein [Kocuria sp.]
MTGSDGAQIKGFEGGRAPSRAGTEGTSASAVSDGPTARPDPYPYIALSSDVAASKDGRRDGRLDIRFGAQTLAAVRARADRLNLPPSTWVKSVVRDALDRRRTEAFDAALGAAVLVIEERAQAGAEARVLADQIRPLAININDLDRRARAGQLVHVDRTLLVELIGLLREVRGLLGDRVAA